MRRSAPPLRFLRPAVLVLAGLALPAEAPGSPRDQAGIRPAPESSVAAITPHRDVGIEPSVGPGLGPMAETSAGRTRHSPRTGPDAERDSAGVPSARSLCRGRALERGAAEPAADLLIARCGRLSSPPTGPPSSS